MQIKEQQLEMDTEQRIGSELGKKYISSVQFSPVTQSCLTLCNTMYSSPPSSSVHGILEARILEWVAMPSSKGSSQHRDQTHVSCSSCIAGRFFTAEPPWNPPLYFVVVQSLSCFRLFSFSISPSNEYSVLISFRID